MISRALIISVIVMLAVATAMSFYVWRTRTHAEHVDMISSKNREVAAPSAGASEQATLYIAYDDAGVLRAEPFRIALPSGRQQRIQELLRALLKAYVGKLSPHPMDPASAIRDVYLVDPGLAVIDVNGAFANGHRSGVLVEELTVASMVQTLSANMAGITRVKILVEGKERDTLAGHADLANFYDVSAINRLAAQLQ